MEVLGNGGYLECVWESSNSSGRLWMSVKGEIRRYVFEQLKGEVQVLCIKLYFLLKNSYAWSYVRNMGWF